MYKQYKKLVLVFLIIQILNFQFLYSDFEFTGIGAKQQGLSNAYTAMSDDVYGIYFNPGGLGFARIPELAGGFEFLMLGLKDSSNLSKGFIGYIYPLKNNKGNIGFAWNNMSLVGYYSENTIFLSYAKKIFPDLSIGINIKPMYQIYVMDEYTNSDPIFEQGRKNSLTVFGIDQGILWNFSTNCFAGLSIININQPDIGFSQTEQIPLVINLGFAYRHNYLFNNSFNFTGDMSYYTGIIKFKFGLEKWNQKHTFAIRGGFENIFQKQFSSFSSGIGLYINNVGLDYSFNIPLTNIKDISGNHKISFVYRFLTSRIYTEEQKIIDENILKEKELLKNKITELETQLKQSQEKLSIQEQQFKVSSSEDINKYKEEIDNLKKYIKQLETKLSEKEYEIKPEKEHEIKPVVKPEIKKEKPKTYTVKEGDTLPNIAGKIYNDTSMWKKIYEKNKDKIIRGQLVPGTILIIP